MKFSASICEQLAAMPQAIRWPTDLEIQTAWLSAVTDPTKGGEAWYADCRWLRSFVEGAKKGDV